MTELKTAGRYYVTDKVEESYKAWLQAESEARAARAKQSEIIEEMQKSLDDWAELKVGQVVQLGTWRWLIINTCWHFTERGVEHGGYYCRRVLKNEGISQRIFHLHVCEAGRIYTPYGWA